jgi:hypothetical protein
MIDGENPLIHLHPIFARGVPVRLVCSQVMDHLSVETDEALVTANRKNAVQVTLAGHPVVPSVRVMSNGIVDRLPHGQADRHVLEAAPETSKMDE